MQGVTENDLHVCAGHYPAYAIHFNIQEKLKYTGHIHGSGNSGHLNEVILRQSSLVPPPGSIAAEFLQPIISAPEFVDYSC